jgi:hypothetical protein
MKTKRLHYIRAALPQGRVQPKDIGRKPENWIIQSPQADADNADLRWQTIWLRWTLGQQCEGLKAASNSSMNHCGKMPYKKFCIFTDEGDALLAAQPLLQQSCTKPEIEPAISTIASMLSSEREKNASVAK